MKTRRLYKQLSAVVIDQGYTVDVGSWYNAFNGTVYVSSKETNGRGMYRSPKVEYTRYATADNGTEDKTVFPELT